MAKTGRRFGGKNGRAGRNEGTESDSNSLYVPHMSNRSRTPSPGLRHAHKKGREKGEDVKKARKQVGEEGLKGRVGEWRMKRRENGMKYVLKFMIFIGF